MVFKGAHTLRLLGPIKTQLSPHFTYKNTQTHSLGEVIFIRALKNSFSDLPPGISRHIFIPIKIYADTTTSKNKLQKQVQATMSVTGVKTVRTS